MTDDTDEVDIDSILDDLWQLRGKFEQIDTDPATELTGDDYRLARLDIAIEQIKDCRTVREDFKSVGLWPDDE